MAIEGLAERLAAVRAQRAPARIRLLAGAKTFPPEAMVTRGKGQGLGPPLQESVFPMHW